MDAITIRKEQTRLRVNTFIRSVYNWMAAGLALTGFAAYYVSTSEALLRLIFGNRLVLFALIIAELVMVFNIAGRIHKIRATTATTLFLIYALLNGVTLSAIFIIYTRSSIASTFFVCSATFVACSIYGWVTKRDLTSLGGFMFMGLIGILIASLINIFVRSSAVAMIVSYIGVLVFIGLTAYDTQYIKNMALTQPADLDAGAVRKGAIVGALKLYLDFINLFIFMLQIFGRRN